MLEQLCPRILDYTHVQKVTVYRKKAHLRITCKYIRISYHCGGGGVLVLIREKICHACWTVGCFFVAASYTTF